MTDKKFNLAFLGSSEFVIPILESIQQARDKTLREIYTAQISLLSQAGDKMLPDWWLEKQAELTSQILEHDIFDCKPNIVVVVSQPDRLNRQKVISNPVVNYARENGLELFLPEKINKLKDEFSQKYSSDLHIGMVASFGQLISNDILNKAKFGFVNWHPSKLPKYRGPTPMQAAINNSDEIVALSWIQVTKEMDAGNIWLQIDKLLNINTGFKELAIEMGELGARTWIFPIIGQILSSFLKTLSEFIPLVQESSQVVFCKMLSKEDRRVNPENQNAFEIYNHWRAFQNFPGTSLDESFFNGEIKLIDCNLIDQIPDFSNSKRFGNWIQTTENKQRKTYLICAGESYLQIKKIIKQDGRAVDFSGFQFS